MPRWRCSRLRRTHPSARSRAALRSPHDLLQVLSAFFTTGSDEDILTPTTAMTPELQPLADALIAARRRKETVAVAGLPVPPSDAEAYAIQDAVAGAFGWFSSSRPTAWKVGAVSREATPSAAPVQSRVVCASPAVFARGEFNRMIIEGEIAFRLRAPLAVDATPQGVSDAIGELVVTIEVVDPRYDDMDAAVPALRLADQLLHGALVVGTGVPWHGAFDWKSQGFLAGAPVHLSGLTQTWQVVGFDDSTDDAPADCFAGLTDGATADCIDESMGGHTLARHVGKSDAAYRTVWRSLVFTGQGAMPTTNKTSLTGIGLNFEPMFVLSPADHFGIVAGPVVDIPLSGKSSSERTPQVGTPQPDTKVKFMNYGLSVGLLGYF